MAALCVLLTAACGYDYLKKRIPNYLIAVMALLGAWLNFCGEGTAGILAHLCKMLCIICIMYPFFKIGTVGAGDVKLLGVTAGFLPFNKIFLFLFVSLLAAAAISVFKLWKEKNYGERFGYLVHYLSEVLRKQSWHPYLCCPKEKYRLGVCLSGPVLISVLLYIGGAY